MIAELGHLALVLALALATALYQTSVPFYGAAAGDLRLMQAAVPAALTQLALIAFAFAALTWSYVSSDFSLANVYANSHTAKPLIYKISGVWGNHEGSMVLWVLILALNGAAVALAGDNLPPGLKARVLSVQGAIGVAFLLFIIVASNPFERLDPAPIEGRGLNPLLQDPALAFHPPFLYAGYVGLSVAFSFAVAALIEGKVDAAWARWVRPWTLAAWMFLTIGIAMGSWWAYYELGWGGFWFWDPVENASLMPWLVATALLHSAIVVEKRNALKIWTVLLAILAFSLSLVGTFLVRSGVLTSVHAFAVDPARGVFILGILGFFIGGALALYAWRAGTLKPGGLFQPVSREGALVLNNISLGAAAAAVFIGTLYPLALEAATGDKISVGPPYFNLTFVPLILPLLLIVPLGPLMPWKRADFKGVAERLLAAAGIALAVGVLTLAIRHRGPWLAPFAMALGAWLIAGSLTELVERCQLGRIPMAAALKRLVGLPGAAWGTALAHCGVGIVLQDGQQITTLEPEKREFQPGRQVTSEVGLHQFATGDLYVVMGEGRSDGGRSVRIYFNPLASLIWLGALIMFIGGAVSLTDRRYRVGAPRRAKPVAVAAE